MPDEQQTSPLDAINKKFGIGGATPTNTLPMPSPTVAPAPNPEPQETSSPLDTINQRFGLSLTPKPAELPVPAPAPPPAGEAQFPTPQEILPEQPGLVPEALAPTPAPVNPAAQPSPAGVKPPAPEVVPGEFGGEVKTLPEAFAPAPRPVATPTPAPVPEKPLYEKAWDTANEWAANIDKPVVDVVHGLAKGLDELIATPGMLASGEWKAALFGDKNKEVTPIISAATGAVKEGTELNKWIDQSSPAAKFVGGLVGGLAAYMLPGGTATKIAGAVEMAPLATKFVSNLLTFTSTDVLSAAGRGESPEQVRAAFVKAIPTAALFTVASIVPVDKITESPWLKLALQSTATGSAFAGSHLMEGETDPYALGTAFLTGFALHGIQTTMAEGLPRRAGERPESGMKIDWEATDAANDYLAFKKQWMRENQVSEGQWDDKIQPVLDEVAKKSPPLEVAGDRAIPEYTAEPDKGVVPPPPDRITAITDSPAGQIVKTTENRAEAIQRLTDEVGSTPDRAREFYNTFKRGDMDAAATEFPEMAIGATEQQRMTAGMKPLAELATPTPAPETKPEPAPTTPVPPMASAGHVSEDMGKPPALKATEPPTPDSFSLPGAVARGPDIAAEANKPATPTTPAAPMGTPGGTAENLAKEPEKAPAPTIPPEPTAPQTGLGEVATENQAPIEFQGKPIQFDNAGEKSGTRGDKKPKIGVATREFVARLEDGTPVDRFTLVKWNYGEPWAAQLGDTTNADKRSLRQAKAIQENAAEKPPEEPAPTPEAQGGVPLAPAANELPAALTGDKVATPTVEAKGGVPDKAWADQHLADLERQLAEVRQVQPPKGWKVESLQKEIAQWKKFIEPVVKDKDVLSSYESSVSGLTREHRITQDPDGKYRVEFRDGGGEWSGIGGFVDERSAKFDLARTLASAKMRGEDINVTDKSLQKMVDKKYESEVQGVEAKKVEDERKAKEKEQERIQDQKNAEHTQKFYAGIDEKVKSMKGKKGEITYPNALEEGKTETIPGTIYDNFGIYKASKNNYVVTHLKTGMSAGTFDTPQEAKRAVYRFNNEISKGAWDFADPKDMPQEIKDKGGKIVGQIRGNWAEKEGVTKYSVEDTTPKYKLADLTHEERLQAFQESPLWSSLTPEQQTQMLHGGERGDLHPGFAKFLDEVKNQPGIGSRFTAPEQQALYPPGYLDRIQMFKAMGWPAEGFDKTQAAALTRGITTDLLQKRLGGYGTVKEMSPESLQGGLYDRGWLMNLKNDQMVMVFEARDGSLELLPGSKGLNPEYAAMGISFKSGDVIAGSHKPMYFGSVIELAKGQGPRTFDHETWHQIEHWLLTPKEREVLTKKYGDNEELRAQAYERWNPKDAPDTIFAKIQDFFTRMVKALTGYQTTEDIFAKARSGEMFGREAKERDRTVPLSPAKYRVDERTPEERRAEREARDAAGIPRYKNFYQEHLKDGTELYERLKTPGNQDVPLYEGQSYTNRAGLQIKDENGKVRFLSKKEIYEHFYDPQKPYAEGTDTVGDPRAAPEGTITPPPAKVALKENPGFFKSIRQNWAENASIRKVGELADRTQTSIVEHLGWAAKEMDKSAAILDKYDRYFKNMSHEDFIEFIDRAETGQLDSVAPELREASQAWRRIADGLHFLIADTKGGEFNYWEDWFPRMFKNPEQAGAVIQTYLKSHGRTMTGPESMLKARTQLLLSQSIKPVAEGGLGLELAYPNMVDAMKAKVHESLRYLTGSYIKQDLLDSGFMQKTTLPGPRGMKAHQPAGWVELQDKSLRGFYAHPEVAKALDNFLSKGLRGGAIYDAVSNPISALQEMFVSLSAFHGMFSTLGNMSHGVGANLPRAIGAALSGDFGRAGGHLKDLGKSVNIVGEVRQGSKILEERLKPGTYPELSGIVDLMSPGGMRSGVTNFGDIWGTKGGAQDFSEMSRAFADVLYDSKLGIPHKIIRSISWPIMNYFVPRVKANAMYRRLSIELDRFQQENGRAPTREESVKIAQETGREVDNIFGQMVYDNLGMKRALRDSLKLWIGFPGWNIGSGSLMAEGAKGIGHLIGEAGRAGVDVLIGQKPKYEPMSRAQRTSMEFYMGMTLVTAVVGSLTMKLLTGNWPGDMKDVFMPQTGGTLANGQPERVRLPTYMRDILSLNHPMNMMAAKENFAIRMFSELTKNQDYFGTQIRDPWASTGEQAKQLAEFGGKSFLPFGVQGYLKSETPGSKALNLIGITPVPRQYSNTPAQNVIDEYNQMMRATTTTKETAELKKLKTDLMKMARDQDESGFGEAASQAVSEGKITRQQVKEIVNESQAPPGMSRFTRLPLEWAVRAWGQASDYEKQQWQPYFLKKVMAEKPENLIKNRDAVAEALDTMGPEFADAAEKVRTLTMPEEPISGVDLTGLGLLKPASEMGGLAEVDAAIAAALESKLEVKAKNRIGLAPLPLKDRKKKPYDILGL